MAFKALLLSCLAVSSVYAKIELGEGNLTVSFLPDSQSSACDDDPLSGLVLTTSSIPTSFTCFNVTDLFTANSSTGFQTSLQTYRNTQDGSIIQPNGVHWQTQNRDDFSAEANYSRIWFEQVDPAGAKPGEDGDFVLYVYAFEDCKQMDPDRKAEPEEMPWFENSCQTEAGGQCQTVPYSIKSFGINNAREYNPSHGKCSTWAFLGEPSAASLTQSVSPLGLKLAGLMAIFLLM